MELPGRAGVTGYGGAIRFDPTKPDGTPRKLMDVARLAGMGWRAHIGLAEGIADAYRWYLDHAAEVRV